MKKETKEIATIFIIVFLVMGTMFYLFGAYPGHKDIKFLITDYSCEQIKQSLEEGFCLIRSQNTAKIALFDGCFSLERTMASYDIRCNVEENSTGSSGGTKK